MSVDVSIVAAFAAGLLSISSPCVLPLVPIYLAHLAGVGSGRADGAARRRIVANAAAYVVGFSFGAGWSPCVGPILGAILTMAAGQGSIERAGFLLVAYSLGLAVPF